MKKQIFYTLSSLFLMGLAGTISAACYNTAPNLTSSGCVPRLTVYCQSSPYSVRTGGSAAFVSRVSGGTGSYSYSWSGSCSGSSPTCNSVFPSQGLYTSTITVTSGEQTASANCQVRVSCPRYYDYDYDYDYDYYDFEFDFCSYGFCYY